MMAVGYLAQYCPVEDTYGQVQRRLDKDEARDQAQGISAAHTRTAAQFIALGLDLEDRQWVFMDVDLQVKLTTQASDEE